MPRNRREGIIRQQGAEPEPQLEEEERQRRTIENKDHLCLGILDTIVETIVDTIVSGILTSKIDLGCVALLLKLIWVRRLFIGR